MKLMKIGTLAAIAVIALSVLTVNRISSADADGVASITPEALDNQIRQFILDNPDVLIQSIQKWQAQQKQAGQQSDSVVIGQRRDEIFNDASAPIAGNVDGDVTVVEFMDYNCAYCRKVFPTVTKLMKDDSNIRFLFKEFPILGPGSQFASKAALASKKQGRYMDFHNALMAVTTRIEKPLVLEIAERIGLDVKQLEEDMEDPEIQTAIDRNFDLAKALAINGTPSFVIGNEVARGAVSMEKLQKLISVTRKAK